MGRHVTDAALERLGCYWYVGKTQSGKTKKAFTDLNDDILGTGWPSLIIDPMPAWNFAGLPHEPTVEAALKKLYGEKTHAIYTPTRDVDVERLMNAVWTVGHVHILWDECSFQMSWRKISPATTRALRGWAHRKLTFRLVTQSPGDIHGDAYKCDPEVYAFRTERVACLERLAAEFGFDPEELKALEQGDFRTKKRGF